MTTYKPVGVDGSSHFPPRVEAHIQALIDAAVAALVAGAPGALDTLNEIAAQLSTDESATAALVASLAAHTSNTSNPHSVTKTQVGLGSADNTADTAKPVSTAQATAIALKADATALTTETSRATAAEAALQNLTNSTFTTGLNNAIDGRAGWVVGSSLVGDGAHDDLPAIQAMLTAAGTDKEVRFPIPAVSYYVNGSIVPLQGQTITVGGGTAQWRGYGDPAGNHCFVGNGVNPVFDTGGVWPYVNSASRGARYVTLMGFSARNNGAPVFRAYSSDNFHLNRVVFQSYTLAGDDIGTVDVRYSARAAITGRSYIGCSGGAWAAIFRDNCNGLYIAKPTAMSGGSAGGAFDLAQSQDVHAEIIIESSHKGARVCGVQNAVGGGNCNAVDLVLYLEAVDEPVSLGTVSTVIGGRLRGYINNGASPNPSFAIEEGRTQDFEIGSGLVVNMKGGGTEPVFRLRYTAGVAAPTGWRNRGKLGTGLTVTGTGTGPFIDLYDFPVNAAGSYLSKITGDNEVQPVAGADTSRPRVIYTSPTIYAGRAVTDGVTTSGSAVVTSATAAWTQADKDRPFASSAGFAATNIKIISVDSATQVTLSAAATGTGTARTFTIGGLPSTVIAPIWSAIEDPRVVTDGVTNTTAGTDQIVTSATAAWTAADRGRVIVGTGIPNGTTLLPQVARTITDAVLNSTTTLTSAVQGRFGQEDVGATVTGTGIPGGTTIAAYVSSTQVTLSAAATVSNAAATVAIGATGKVGMTNAATAAASGLTFTIGRAYGGKILGIRVREASGLTAGCSIQLGVTGASNENVNFDPSTLPSISTGASTKTINSYRRVGYPLLAKVVAGTASAGTFVYEVLERSV